VAAERPGWSLTPRLGLSDHPVCGARAGFAEIFLMPHPPLLNEEGNLFPEFLLARALGNMRDYGN